MINIHGWQQRTEDALNLLPAELREQLVVTFDGIGPLQCERCGYSWFRPELEGPLCDVCQPGLLGVASVELLTRCADVTIAKDGVVVARSTLAKRGKARHIIVAGRNLQGPGTSSASPTFFTELKVGSAKKENSVEMLQRIIRSAVFPHLGLATDRDGEWGWPGGLRLDGTPMVPHLLELMDMMERENEPGQAIRGTEG